MGISICLDFGIFGLILIVVLFFPLFLKVNWWSTTLLIVPSLSHFNKIGFISDKK